MAPNTPADRNTYYVARVREFIEAAGFDVDNKDDRRKFRECMEWVAEQREQEKGAKTNWQKLKGSAFIALLSALAVTIGDYFVRIATHMP